LHANHSIEKLIQVLHGIQEAVRVRYRGFRSLIDIREEVKNEIVQSKSRMSGIALVGSRRHPRELQKVLLPLTIVLF
jgi:hypothetical protein